MDTARLIASIIGLVKAIIGIWRESDVSQRSEIRAVLHDLRSATTDEERLKTAHRLNDILKLRDKKTNT